MQASATLGRNTESVMKDEKSHFDITREKN